MKKLFISQPMRGKTDEEIKEERLDRLMTLQQGISLELNKAKLGKTLEVLVEGYDEESFLFYVEVIDSFFEKAPADTKPLWFLGKSLELLADADVAYFAPGWNDARGCIIEHDCAIAYGIKSIVA